MVVQSSTPGADCNFAAPKTRETPDAPPYDPYFVTDITPIFAVHTLILLPPPDYRQGRFATPNRYATVQSALTP